MSKDSRSGGKFSGNHTTFIPAAALVADIAHRCTSVYRITPGFIKAGLKSVNGKRRVKIKQDGCQILVAVRDNTSQQEIHIYATDVHQAIQHIARGSRDAGFSISF